VPAVVCPNDTIGKPPTAEDSEEDGDWGGGGQIESRKIQKEMPKPEAPNVRFSSNFTTHPAVEAEESTTPLLFSTAGKVEK